MRLFLENLFDNVVGVGPVVVVVPSSGGGTVFGGIDVGGMVVVGAEVVVVVVVVTRLDVVDVVVSGGTDSVVSDPLQAVATMASATRDPANRICSLLRPWPI